MSGQDDLFGAPAVALPAGMRYETGFLSPEEERHWIAFAQSLPLKEMDYKGYTARRRVVSFGGKYDYVRNRLGEGPPIPAELDPLRGKVAAWLGVEPQDFTQVLVAEYREGTPLGWHRDVPDFEDVIGVSLLSEAVMRFRPYPPDAPKKADILKIAVAPRSIYLLRGPARWEWQHSVAPTPTLRYSITFRTPRPR
ncbi:alpha-ketoglutarate-dependent dioxygenase AlkB [Ramlibacter sp. PS4R-6]|uniref:alpha-ketoglutarate-dependent dioxygenase AlkB n=1 Tax=Ramlibacter sp. PS4R-6 TaxID=3133438 RepID=UPI0030A94D4C